MCTYIFIYVYNIHIVIILCIYELLYGLLSHSEDVPVNWRLRKGLTGKVHMTVRDAESLPTRFSESCASCVNFKPIQQQ